MNSRILMGFIFLALTACAGKEPPPTSQIIDHQENLRTEPNQARLVEPSVKVVGKVNSIVVKEIRTRTLNNRMIVDYTLYNDLYRWLYKTCLIWFSSQVFLMIDNLTGGWWFFACTCCQSKENKPYKNAAIHDNLLKK